MLRHVSALHAECLSQNKQRAVKRNKPKFFMELFMIF